HITEVIPSISEKDVRRTAFAHLANIVSFMTLSFYFINNHLLPPENEWWSKPPQQSLYGSYDVYNRSIAANSFNNAFSKYTVMHKLFGELESTFRQLLRKLDPSAANNATERITSVFKILCATIGDKPAESNELLKLLRLSRNTIHNNGVFYSKKQTDDEVTYKGKTYQFKHGKPISFVNWEFLIDRVDDARQLLRAVITNPNIIAIEDEIPDMFAENRTKVAAP
ncbi:MAG: hypothetical protein ABJB61_11595, partial [bacterium]